MPNSDVDNGGAEPKDVGVGIFRPPSPIDFVCENWPVIIESSNQSDVGTTVQATGDHFPVCRLRICSADFRWTEDTICQSVVVSVEYVM